MVTFPLDVVLGSIGNITTYYRAEYLALRLAENDPVNHFVAQNTVTLNDRTAFEQLIAGTKDTEADALKMIWQGGHGGPIYDPNPNPPVTYNPPVPDLLICGCELDAHVAPPLSAEFMNWDFSSYANTSITWTVHYLYDHLGNTRVTCTSTSELNHPKWNTANNDRTIVKSRTEMQQLQQISEELLSKICLIAFFYLIALTSLDSHAQSNNMLDNYCDSIEVRTADSLRIYIYHYCENNNYILESYLNDNLKAVYRFEEGVQNGGEISYYPNGQVEFIVNFENGKRKGLSIQFYENGKISSIGCIDETRPKIIKSSTTNDEEHGIQITTEVVEPDWEKVGLWYFYSENGSLLRYAFF